MGIVDMIDKKFNVCSVSLTTEEITREILEEWETKEPKSRELLNYRYGHNYTNLNREAEKMGYLALYRMFDVELTKEENKELDDYNYSLNYEKEGRIEELKAKKRGR